MSEKKNVGNEPCASCGNQYAHSFEVSMNGERYVFDSFECAIQRLAPRCSNCGVAIVGHGVEADERTYCCAHCARAAGVKGLRDHMDPAAE
jgi:hypothetical protein